MLEKEMARGNLNDGKYKAVLDNIDKHFKAKGLGTVCFASGKDRKDSDGRRMDWALIQLHDEAPLSKNYALRNNFSQLQLTLKKQEKTVKYSPGPNGVISATKAAEKGMWVAKEGRTTKVTAGEVNSMEATFFNKDFTSREAEICPLPDGDIFCLEGDSGSAIISAKGEWVGMLCWRENGGAGYMTPVASLMKDIKATTGGEISLA